jgi:hypothetical protein
MTAIEAAERPGYAVGPTDDPWPILPAPTTEDRRTVYERMVAVIAELPAIGKTQKNTQQNFMFRGHDDVMNALNPLLAKHGVFIVPDVLERITGERVTGNQKTMYEVNLHVRFTFYGLLGDSFRASGWGEGTDMGDKGTNKAMTMAFKYVVAQAFALATAEISDADQTSPEETTRGAAAAAAASGRREFDPAIHLLDGAIVVRTEEDATALRMAQRDLDPSQDWAAIEDFVVLSTFGKQYDALEGSEKREFYTRLANAVAKVDQIAGPGDFPPPSTEQIKEAYAWAFKGVVLALSGPVSPSETSGDQPAAEASDAPENAS